MNKEKNIIKSFYILGFFKLPDDLSDLLNDIIISFNIFPWYIKLPFIFLIKCYFSKKDLKKEIPVWMKVVFTSGAWSFFPVILGIGLTYWIDPQGVHRGAVKGHCEFIAICLMSLVVAVFLLRVIIYRMRTDIVMLILAIGFLCREIHFTGTSAGVYVVAGIAGLLAWIWRDDILDELDGKNQVKAAMFCMFWSYLVTLLIQRRVFKAHRIGILPDEDLLHIPLEEITENFAHLAFLAVAVIAFMYARKRRGFIGD